MSKYARNSGLGLPGGPPPLSFAESNAQAEEYFEEYGVGFEQRLGELAPLWARQAELVREWARAWVLQGYQNHDPDVLAEWVTDDFVQEDPLNLGRFVQGREAFRQVMVETFIAFPDCAFVATGPFCLGMDGETLVVPWRTFGHFSGPLAWGPPGQRKSFAPTHRRFDFEGCDFYRFRDGKVASLRSLYDPLQVAEQLALIPNRQGVALRIAPYVQSVIASLPLVRG
ncbi:ester cyclase [Nocardia sp. NPDC050408]|uniref:ester cyclase n=1 Tax=Nocardia sp. NPDC050408 TaxID=3364319 RepID=UPI0037B09D1A